MEALKNILYFGFVISYASLSSQVSTPFDSHYIAGVVEFHPASSSLDSLDRVNENLAEYLKIITSEKANETDIIVFPEGTLNNYLQLSYVPDPIANVTPCDNSTYADFLQQISCQAKSSRKYIVINLTEKENCTSESQAIDNDPRPCAADGFNTYNTNVVFDRNGVVVSRYRKWNLYKEPWNTTFIPKEGIFETDFGVRFGHFICFDILFYTPASDIVKSGITDFIFPSMWFAQLPFLTGVQIQQSWAYSYDVNLLTAGASNPSIGSTGTGIYSGAQGPIVSVMNSSPVRKLYVAKVTKREFARINPAPILQLQISNSRAVSGSTLKGVYTKRDYRIDDYTTALVNTSQQTTQLCYESFCCEFTIRTKSLIVPPNSTSYQYRYAVYSGLRPYTDMKPIYTRICTIFSCLDETMDSCALAFDEDANVAPAFSFTSIKIEADFNKTEELLLMPNTVDQFLMPLTVGSFHFNITDKGQSKNVHFELLSPRDNLMNFGIYGNYFHGHSSATIERFPKTLALVLFIILIVKNLFIY